MDLIGRFTAKLATGRNMDRKAMDLLAVQDSCRQISFRTKKTTLRDQLTRRTVLKSKLPQERDVQDVEELSTLQNKCLPRDQYGTKGVSHVQNAADHLTPFFPAMVPTRKSTVRLATQRDSGLRVMVTATHPHWSPSQDIRQLQLTPDPVRRHQKARVVEDVVSLSTLRSRCCAEEGYGTEDVSSVANVKNRLIRQM
jgi:hypothetical protein